MIGSMARLLAGASALAGGLSLVACSGAGSTSFEGSSQPLPPTGARGQAAAPTLTLWAIDPYYGVRATGELRAYDVSTASKTATLVPNSIYDQVLPSINGKPAGFDQPSGLAFDKTGHLWVANQPSNLVFSFTIHAPGVAPTLNLNSALTLPDPTPYNGGPVEMAYDPITNSVWTAGGQGLFDCAIGPSGALTLVPVTVSGNSLPIPNSAA